MDKKYSNKYVIETGIGLQDVDGLKNSSYFLNESNRYIKGEITLDEFDQIIKTYYQNKPDVEERSEEADKVSIRIARIISDDYFAFTPGTLVAIHKDLFKDIYPHAGKLRTYNFTKKEWVLDGASVFYADYRLIPSTLQIIIDLEKDFNYLDLSIDETIDHLARFIADLWQIHAFEEGNTRTTAVFIIKYLRSLGLDVNNDIFAKNAWYFRNSLVRANYTHIRKGIHKDYSFLKKFLRNMLLNENHVLKNREMHVSFAVLKEPLTNDEKVLELIKINPHITSIELAKSVGVSVRTIKNILKVLVFNKHIKRMNGKRYGYWKILKE